MSGVATLKVRGAKRAFDEMAVDVPTAGCSPARFTLRPSAIKRSRFSPPPGPMHVREPAAARQVQAVASAAHTHGLPVPCSSSTQSSSPPKSARPPSPPPPPSQCPRVSAEEIAALARHVPKRLKRVVDRVATGALSPGEKLFTVVDLREIVTSVVAEREDKLTDEFTKVLNDRLAEQFRVFTKFNEDYIARDRRGREFTYLS